MRGDGAATDGFEKVKLNKRSAGFWRVKAKGAGMSAGAPPQTLAVLLRIGDSCHLTAPPLECRLSASGRSLRCWPPLLGA